jgi:hypothetical protein
MSLKDIQNGIAVNFTDVKSAERLSLKGIGKYLLVRLIGIICFLLGVLGIVFICHYFGVKVSF